MFVISGGWQSDFPRNSAREGLAAVDLEPGDIQCGHVGNFVGELFAGQGLLGGFFGLVHPDFDGMPSARHEAACASGSIALDASKQVTGKAGDYQVEGVEDYDATDGAVVLAPHAGVFRFESDLIIGWRDYVDVGVMEAQKGAAPASTWVKERTDRETI